MLKMHSLCQLYCGTQMQLLSLMNVISGKLTSLSLCFYVCEMAMVVKWAVEIRNSETSGLEIRTLNLSPFPLFHPILHLAVTHLTCGIFGGSLSVLFSIYKTEANMWSLVWHLSHSPIWSTDASHQPKFPSQWTWESYSSSMSTPCPNISFGLKYKASPASNSQGLRR